MIYITNISKNIIPDSKERRIIILENICSLNRYITYI